MSASAKLHRSDQLRCKRQQRAERSSASFARGLRDFVATGPGLDGGVGQVFCRKLTPSGKARRIECPVGSRFLNRAPGFMIMGAIPKTTPGGEVDNLREQSIEPGLDVADMQRSHPGRVDHPAATSNCMEGARRGCVTPLGVGLSNGPRRLCVLG